MEEAAVVPEKKIEKTAARLYIRDEIEDFVQIVLQGCCLEPRHCELTDDLL